MGEKAQLLNINWQEKLFSPQILIIYYPYLTCSPQWEKRETLMVSIYPLQQGLFPNCRGHFVSTLSFPYGWGGTVRWEVWIPHKSLSGMLDYKPVHTFKMSCLYYFKATYRPLQNMHTVIYYRVEVNSFFYISSSLKDK